MHESEFYCSSYAVTILILIDGFLQYVDRKSKSDCIISHNPYFNRWFSAIQQSDELKVSNERVTILILIDGFLQ